MAMNGISSESGRVQSWAEDAPAVVDLTQPEQDEWTRRVADEMLELFPGAGDLLRRFIPQLSPIIDTQCGFKIYKGDVARHLYGECITDGFTFDIEIIMRAQREGYRIKEFPIDWTCDRDSRLSPTRSSWPVLTELLTMRRVMSKK